MIEEYSMCFVMTNCETGGVTSSECDEKDYQSETSYAEFCRGGQSDLCHLPACRGRSRPKYITQVPTSQHMDCQDVRRLCR